MSLSQTYASRKQLIAQNLNTVGVSRAKSTDGLTTLANYILEAQGKTNTILTINTPLHLVYTDDFLITGVLTDNNGNLLPNKLIKLKVGSTVVETQTTDTNGTVEFTHTPVRMGNHTFQLVYDGDSTYESALSTIVSKDAEKETTVLNISIPAGSLNVYDDGYFQVSGSLLSDDGERISGKTITVSDGTNNIASFTTDSNGAFSGSCNIDVAGSYNVTITFAGDNYYTSSVVSRNVTVIASTLSFALTDGSDILSYADEQQTPGSQYATLTATLTGANIVNQAIELYKDNVLWDTLYTDNTGKVSKTYYSQGVGDVEFKAVKGTLSSETYELEDTVRYDDASIDNTSNYTVPSDLSMSWSTDHYNVSSTSQGNRFIDFAEIGSDDFEFSALINTSNRNMGLSISNDGTHLIGLYGVSSGTGFIINNGGGYNYNRTSTTLTNNQWYKYTLIKNGSTYTGTIETLDGTVFGNWTQTVANFTKAKLMSAWNVSMQIKQIKVKRL